ncbi:hypothetical protein [Streptomyces sp. HNM0574]|uniref:hypothetical protein n=1 Tax=Streptomyces sp. HNM0574 TaxID=2714954 RepID=UPI00146ADCA5|nr:hypothetical protein [Streptomyces sp. HNM0574]NLU66312.1 hypothetical protein [Streptomyces sp. HNM0574]
MLTTTVCAALSAAGLAVAFLTAYRRRFTAATRIAAFALVPVGLAMSGLIGLVGRVGQAVGSWAADLVLKPTVWAGFGVLALAVVLYVVARFASRRGASRADTSGKAATPQGVTGASAGALATRKESTPAAKPGSSAGSGDGDDFSDIEAILKKHGI